MNAPSVTILDGGMGRELNRRNAPFQQPEWSALAMMQAPEIVKEVHHDFIESGARVIATNSYSLVPFHIGEEVFAEQGYSLAELSGEVARQAAAESKHNVLVAGSLPPLFGSYRADLFRADRVEEVATPLIQALNNNVDVWLNETQCLVEEVKAVKSLVDKHDSESKPFWVSFTLEDSEPTIEPQLRSGELVREAIKAMVDIKVAAILFNCSQPEIIGEAIKITRDILAELGCDTIEIGAYANAFPPQPKEATANDGLDELREDLSPPAYLDWVKHWVADGATLVGGCCGIGPEHIEAMSNELA
ncbi:homocysteine S-methyltransferase family protein [Marinomonas mediterranea]|jgi:homocysteine S-methyltransferase (EC 2.1.1.10)|uniref:Homocysteine S-methyltransferase n=1 Tax=Marinomonas mediterranea (strain ATCC 700492 / JCM 21426 / NBRC 103028 / MMB-1) TaxID=717774 RepID=F2K3Z7_MARM1|nr:homocysteine S-methyltransferase family protein [Marinomonas mediterranea]ADZ91339.1 homocysteine S-methyltransferase [Marinomonas mediterranea MMB-1]WCN09309.1 homocysteine S-methyltransferase [Marinomonas mediterranea]WCN13391.1 homocysteine S-methyltransferase [Marinomonas mediterranea]WCN17459.1 homocysteine S-methyltransferase [Marinomonas mediterranea MMB-1]